MISLKYSPCLKTFAKTAQKKVKSLPKHLQRDPLLEEFANALLSLVSRKLQEKQAPYTRVFWNHKLRSRAGLAYPTLHCVVLNPSLLHFGTTCAHRILRHELAHLLADFRHPNLRDKPHHGAHWQQACSDLGIPGENLYHSIPLPQRTLKRKYFYHCPVCKSSLSRTQSPLKDKPTAGPAAPNTPVENSTLSSNFLSPSPSKKK